MLDIDSADATADLDPISNVDWHNAHVTLDGRVFNDCGEEVELADIEAACAGLIKKLRAMVAAAKGEE